LRGLPPKEISVKNLSHIIQARMQEILDYVVYHLKQIDLDKKLYGGIILTGGGAQLENLIQLTEYVTGLGARLGYPNEHLAGGHAEALMNPMYATCIGLILRGYHDYESGRLRFVGEGGNIIHSDNEDAFLKIDNPQEDNDEQPEDNDINQKQQKIKERMTKLFDGLKGKFVSLFEDVDDQEMK